MSSSRPTRANRRNSKHSTGPVTPQGKAAVAQNANAKSGAALAVIQRYAAAADRAYFRAHRVLTQGRSAVVRNKANEAKTWFREQLENIRAAKSANPPRPATSPQPSSFMLLTP